MYAAAKVFETPFLPNIALGGGVTLGYAAAPQAAANDTTPRHSAVTLPARLTVERRRERAVYVSISSETVTFAAPDRDAATQPLSSYRGVAVTVERHEGEVHFTLTLEHEDAEHTVPLSCATDANAIAREWQAWAKALALPLLAVDADGVVHAELSALGVILAEGPLPRRRGSALVGRRSRYGRRRRNTPLPHTLEAAPKHAGEREIIART